MNAVKNIKNISNVNHKKTLFNNQKKNNSPISFNKRIKNYLLVNSHHRNIKNSFDLKMAKSSKNMDFNKTCNSQKKFKDADFTSLRIQKANSNSPNNSKENSKINNYIQKKITFQSFNSKIPKKHSIDNILKNIYRKDKIITRILNKNKINSSINSISLNRNKKTNLKNYININCTNKIYLNVNNNSNSSSNNKIKKKIFQSSNLSISLDNILSKTINKTQKKTQQKSIEKNKNLSEKKKKLKNKISVNLLNKNNLEKKENNITRGSYKINLDEKLKGKNINIEKNKKIFKHYNYRQRESRIKSENITEIMRHLTKNKLLPNNSIKSGKNNKYIKKTINGNPILNKNDNIIKSKNSKLLTSAKIKNISHRKYTKPCDYSRDNSDVVLDESYNALNNAKIISENRSTTDKSLNTKKNNSIKSKINITPNNMINRYNNIYNNKDEYHFKNTSNNSRISDNDEFVTYEFDIGNEQNNKINGVKTNNFDVKKPKEENLKFTLMKDDMESNVSVSQASKIVIGKIDGYKDIIETDIKNYQISHSKYKSMLYNKKFNFFNSTNRLEDEIGDYPFNNTNKKISNLSTLLKKESEPITFNDANFYDSFNMTNLDGISSKITNNIINENKKVQFGMNYNDINENYFESQKLPNRKNSNFNNFSISFNTDRSLYEFSKKNNYNFNKNDNLEYSLNKDCNINNNSKNVQYTINNINNKNICHENKNTNANTNTNTFLEKINDINKNCIII